MNLQELITHVAQWGEVQRDVSLDSSDAPEEQYKRILEREILKKGKSLLKRYEDFQERIQGLEADKAVLKTQLLDFERETKQMVDLPMGDQVMIDVSGSPRVQEFWKNARLVLGGVSGLDAIDLKDLLKDPSTGEKLYDPVFLSQESDDLLRYL